MHNEADTRAKLIDPTLYGRGWSEDLISREVTAGAIEILNGKPRKSQGRVDYVLRVRVNREAQPIAVALIEAKSEGKPPSHGLEQAKLYAQCKRSNVPFVFSSNGHLFVEFDRFTGHTTAPQPLAAFPTPNELRARYELAMGISLESELAKPLLTHYSGGEGSRRYYQDAAIRAVLEKLAKGERHALLSLATGAGKTFIAVHLLKRIADAGQLSRALFVCDRDELRSQGLGALQNVFGTNAAEVFLTADGKNHAGNARVHVATYQTLGVDREEADANFLTTHYPENYFSHIVIDECHRSAWGKWSQVLTRNPNAVKIGLTATPREIIVSEKSKEAEADAKITADNFAFFGEPVYEYDMSQGIEDGYLAACEIIRRDIFLDRKPQSEQITGVEREDLEDKQIRDARTGEDLSVGEIQARYEATSFEDRIILPDRVRAMTSDLFKHLVENGGPEQKTIIFCARDDHADRVATAMNNLYADWAARTGKPRLNSYAFKCTSESGGNDFLPDFRAAARHHFIATTVELLTTGVDVPCVRNIVFFKYVRSPIAFYQMVGRGTRLDVPSQKMMFRVYDYTDATRLFGEAFRSKNTRPKKPRDGTEPDPAPVPPEQTIEVEGFEVRVSDAGRYIITNVDGKAMPVTVEEYRQRIAARLVEEAPTLDEFRSRWITPEVRQALIQNLPDAGRSPFLLRNLTGMEDYDLYDVLAEIGYGMAPNTRRERADSFGFKNAPWLSAMPDSAARTVRALAIQFALAGTDGLERPEVFRVPDVVAAGGLVALKALGEPSKVLGETKARMFAP